MSGEKLDIAFSISSSDWPITSFLLTGSINLLLFQPSKAVSKIFTSCPAFKRTEAMSIRPNEGCILFTPSSKPLIFGLIIKILAFFIVTI